MKKKTIVLLISSLILLSGCGNLENSGGQVAPQKADKDEPVTTTGQINNDSYQALLVDGQYKTSSTRTMVANRMNSAYNLDNFNNGLLELSKEQFPTADYLFQEGQFLSANMLKEWLGRESGANPKGLNNKDEKSPLILQQIIEFDYLDKSSQSLGGLSIGLALNSVDYSVDTPVEISDADVESTGKQLVEKILPRIREIEGLSNIPIKFGLFKQSSNTDVAGGKYFSSVLSKSGTSMDGWQNVDETYVVLPVPEGETGPAINDGLNVKYTEFKKNVQAFFPNLSGFSGRAYYRNQQMKSLLIVIEAKYYTPSELESFTQFVGNSVQSIFNIEGEVQVQINNLESTKAFVVKPTGSNAVTAQAFN